MGLKDSISEYFQRHPRAKKVLGIATVIATNFATMGSGSAVLAVAAGSIARHQDDKEKVKSGELISFFKEAIQDPVVRESIKEAVREGGIEIAAPVKTAMNQLGASAPESGQFVDTLKAELTTVALQMGIIREMISYYEIPDSPDRVKNVWRLPSYIDDVLVFDEARMGAINAAVEYARNGENVVILGAPGSGKTTAMYAVWKELDDEMDIALVWDTKDVSRIHEKEGVVLFNDDLPETRELSKVIIERNVKGIVATAREQEWSRLPITLREQFHSIMLPNIPDEIMLNIASNHLDSQNVTYDTDALSALVKKAQGSPIYIRYMSEEIGTEFRNGMLNKLIATRVAKAPRGMTNYVVGILSRILFDLEGTIYKPKDGALPVIKTLLCLADLPNYETHEVHLNQMFFKVKAQTDGPGPFNAVKQYLSRDPRFFSLKFMHDTLADVLRGKVDNPIVGDIRMLAQEMGVAGRRDVEKKALSAGWEDVKAEYEIDQAGGLESLLAYSYFAAKNFGTEHVDALGLKLANQHIENPLSQSLFAIIGPMTEVPTTDVIDDTDTSTIADEIQTDEGNLIESIEKPKVQEITKMGDIGEMIRQKIGKAIGPEATAELSEGLKKLENLPELLGGSKSVSKYIEAGLEGKIALKASKETSIDKLSDLLEQESVSPGSLSRTLRKACIKISIQMEKGRLKDKETKGDIIAAGAKRLVLLDSMMYIETLDEIGEGLSAALGEVESARIITDITSEIAVSLLDTKTRKTIETFFYNSAKQSEKMGNFDGMYAFLIGKWELAGFDPKDLSYVSNQVGKLMQLHRTPFALETLNRFLDALDDDQQEYRLGLTLQAFKHLSKAVVGDRNEFRKVLQISYDQLSKQIEWYENKESLKGNKVAGELCTTLVTSSVSMMNNYVKNAGKMIPAEELYPLLHEAGKVVVLDVIKIILRIGDNKAVKTILDSIKRMKEDSVHKTEMLNALQQ
ncbi:MAG: hypothetical protein ACTSU3_06135 [Candidatus Thorarchaeota archaeon]